MCRHHPRRHCPTSTIFLPPARGTSDPETNSWYLTRDSPVGTGHVLRIRHKHSMRIGLLLRDRPIKFQKCPTPRDHPGFPGGKWFSAPRSAAGAVFLQPFCAAYVTRPLRGISFLEVKTSEARAGGHCSVPTGAGKNEPCLRIPWPRSFCRTRGHRFLPWPAHDTAREPAAVRRQIGPSRRAVTLGLSCLPADRPRQNLCFFFFFWPLEPISLR